MQSKTPATTHEVSLCGSRVQFWTYNDHQPKTILMLHGFSGNHRGLTKLIDELSDYRLVVPDFPGFGDSTPMTKFHHTVTGYGHFVEQFIEALGLRKPTLLGHSLGSVVAARVAATAPQLIDEYLILISPISSSPLRSIAPRHAAARLGEAHYWVGINAPKVGDRLLKSHTISRTTTFLLTKTRDKKLRREIYNHHLNDLNYLKHKEVFYETYKSLNRDGIINYAPHITQETLLIAGAADSMWPRKTQQAVQKLLQRGKLILLPKVGHLTHFESPRPIAEAIEQFLTKN